MNQPSEEQKRAALEAGREGMKKAYERSREMSIFRGGNAFCGSSWPGRPLRLPASCPAAGHSVKLGPEGAVICKDGSCLTMSHGGLTFTQAVSDKDVPPVVQAKNK